jgi:hypothetical protein
MADEITLERDLDEILGVVPAEPAAPGNTGTIEASVEPEDDDEESDEESDEDSEDDEED